VQCCRDKSDIENDGDVLHAGYPGSLPYPPAGGYPRKLRISYTQPHAVLEIM